MHGETEDRDGFVTPDERTGQDLMRLSFIDATINRYLPILSLTYIASVLGMALKRGGTADFLFRILTDEKIYDLALMVAIWVSIPAIIWISMRSMGALGAYANNWYKSVTTLMVLTLFSSFLLFPPDGQGHQIWYTARLFIAAAIPIHIVQYWFFTKEGLPAAYSAVLGAIALSLALYGLLII